MVKSVPGEHQIERNLEIVFKNFRNTVNRSTIGLAGRISIGEAISLAISVHQDQRRDEGDPYIIHPIRVAADYLRRWPHQPARFVITAILHDVLEDGEVAKSDLVSNFGRIVAVSVEELTKNKELPSEEMRHEYLERLQCIPEDLLQVKMVDRLDNLRSCFLNPDTDKVARYIDYSRAHYLPLAKRAGEKIQEDMQDVIHELAARIED